MTARGPFFIGTIIKYALTHNAIDVMDDDNFAIASTAKVHISIVLIGTTKKTSIEPTAFAKQLGMTL